VWQLVGYIRPLAATLVATGDRAGFLIDARSPGRSDGAPGRAARGTTVGVASFLS
jgi:hypothetical protein